MKKYSRVPVSGNVADYNLDSDYLVVFAARQAGRHFKQSVVASFTDPEVFAGPVHMMEAIATPFVFLKYLVGGPLIYKRSAEKRQADGGLENKLEPEEEMLSQV